MPKQLQQKVGNKAKGRRSARHKANGKYARQRLRTEANKAKRKARLFSFYDIMSLQSQTNRK